MQQDYNREVPSVFGTAAVSVPLTPALAPIMDFGTDFYLGQIWGMAHQNAMNLAYDTKSNPAHDGKVATALAKKEFSAKNCSLL